MQNRTSTTLKSVLTVMLVGCVVPVGSADALAQAPLHEQIDQLIAAQAGDLPVAAPCTDSEFIRRVHLDFAGRISTAAETRAFLADVTPDKRLRLIDQLLAGPLYAERMSDALHVMLMERLGDHPEWRAYLQHALQQNVPWDILVRGMLSANQDDPNLRGGAFFISKRLENYGQQAIDYPGLTRDVGRLLLGVDLQCAQCHDHLFIDDYKQEHFQGLHAFLSPTFVRSDLKFPAVGENPVGKKTEFMSVFTKVPNATGPRLPGGAEVAIVAFEKPEDAFAIAPDRAKNFPGVLKFRPLAILAEQLPRSDNAYFTRNAVNRFWFLLMGRGLVHPLDLAHSGNPASHPELLDLLSREFVAHQLDIKWLLRELAQTQVYQRSTLMPEGVTESPPEKFLVSLERPLSAEQLLNSMLLATGRGESLWQTHAEARAKATADQPAPKSDYDTLRERFLKAFANPPREPELEFAPSVKAALFLQNDDIVLSWLAPEPPGLVTRLLAIADNPQLMDEAYLTVLSRLPDDVEREESLAWLTQPDRDRTRLVGQFVWSLLSSTEFCVQH